MCVCARAQLDFVTFVCVDALCISHNTCVFCLTNNSTAAAAAATYYYNTICWHFIRLYAYCNFVNKQITVTHASVLVEWMKKVSCYTEVKIYGIIHMSAGKKMHTIWDFNGTSLHRNFIKNKKNEFEIQRR